MKAESLLNMDFIFGEDGPIKDAKPDYVPRQSQIEGAKKILEALDKQSHAILEGACGFGKTFAYLIPTFLNIIESGFNKKVLIVTNGISLQEQLYYKDVPFVKDLFKNIDSSYDFKYSLLKGKQNFICENKIRTLIADSFANKIGDPELEKIVKAYEEKGIGDLSELDFVPSKQSQDAIACTKQGECTGKKCSNYDDCHYYKFKQRCQSSNVIITNYHMLFSDEKTGNNILPHYDILVCDEGHEMTDIFRNFNELIISVSKIKGIRNNISELFNKSKDIKSRFEDDVAALDMVQKSEIYFQEVREGVFGKWDDVKLMDNIELKSQIDLAEILRFRSCIFDGLAENLTTKLQILCPDGAEPSEDDAAEVNSLQVQLNLCKSISDELGEMIQGISNIKSECSNKDVVWWMEKDKDKEGKDMGTCSICRRQVKVADKLSEVFFSREGLSCIITSATLSVGGAFDYIKEETGIGITGKPIIEFIGQSPFNLTEQELWYLPRNHVDGNNREFDEKFIPQLERLINSTGGGVLCLFTSVRAMNNAYNQLRYSLYRYKILKQGMKPKMQLVDDFKQDGNAVLFATKSFFTGVDIPGESLRCVAIDKLPFPSPGDPVMQKLSQDNNSFFKYFIPMMIITLKQAVGRGVRSINDKCVIAVFDGRLATARYKTRINGSFPYKKTGTMDLDDVSKFIVPKDIDDCNKWYTTEDDDETPF